MKTLLSIILFVLSVNLLLSQSGELKYDLEKGTTYKVISSTVQDQKMTVQGADRNTETKSSSCFSLKMLDAKPEFFLAEVRFDTIKTSVSMPPMELSSAKKGDINSENPVDVTNCILNRLSNSTLLVKMGYTGHVKDIMNHKIIEQTVLDGTDSLKGQAAMAKAQLEMMITKNALIGMIEGITAYLPGEEVNKGAKWESSYVSRSGGVGMSFTGNYELKDLSAEQALIEGEVMVEPESSQPTMMNGAEITNELKGLGKTNMKIDPETGWIVHASSKIQMSGNMHVKAPGQNMSIPIESQITTETSMIE